MQNGYKSRDVEPKLGRDKDIIQTDSIEYQASLSIRKLKFSMANGYFID